MSVITVNTRPFSLKLRNPFGISRGSIVQAKNVLITIRFEEIVAYGEAAPSLYYGEDQNSVIEFINSFVKNRRFEEYLTNVKKLKDDLNDFSMNVYRGSSSSARAALEMAMWDLIGKIDNKSLYQFFFENDPFLSNGNEYKNIQPTSFTIGLDNLLVIKDKVRDALSSGYKVLKIKLGSGFENDLNILKTIKELKGENHCRLRVDANGGWDLSTAKKILPLLADYDVELLEQPLSKGEVHKLSSLVKDSPIPVFVDEDCMVGNQIENLAGKVHGINIKLMKCGSILEAFNMISLARAYNLKVMLGCMIESSCAISAAVHLSPLADYVDLDGHLLLEKDPFTGLVLENGKVIPSFDAGLGVSLSENY